jgi:cytochrome c oxidase assembly protein subunit 11
MGKKLASEHPETGVSGCSLANTRRKQRKHFLLLVAWALCMFGFAFSLIPLYDVFCAITGLNGKPSLALLGTETDYQSVNKRKVNIEFISQVGNGLPWEFRPVQQRLKVALGEMSHVQFYARNRSNHTVTGHAVASISPGLAARHVHKTECFCFRQQRLQAAQAMQMPVTFIVDTELPKSVNTLTLSYTFYPATNESKTARPKTRDNERHR